MLCFLSVNVAFAINPEDFVRNFNGAILNNCGKLEVCWYNPSTGACTEQKPPNITNSTIEFKIITSDVTKKVWFAMNNLSNLKTIADQDGTEVITYRESYPKSMPAGPGSQLGLSSRYTLEINVLRDKILKFSIYQEDFDPKTKTWEPWFDIRFVTDNPLVCD